MQINQLKKLEIPWVDMKIIHSSILKDLRTLIRIGSLEKSACFQNRRLYTIFSGL